MIGHSMTAQPLVIAQQYSSVTVSLRFHSPKEKFGVRAKLKSHYLVQFLIFKTRGYV